MSPGHDSRHRDRSARFGLEVRPDGDRAFIIPRGELDLISVEDVAASIADLVAGGVTDIVLDLRHLTFMDSAGVRLVVQQTRRDDATVRLIDGTELIARLFDLTGLRAHLPFYTPGR
jgi:anti-sigma B factor antagonist